MWKGGQKVVVMMYINGCNTQGSQTTNRSECEILSDVSIIKCPREAKIF